MRRRQKARPIPGWSELRLVVVSPFLDRQHGTELCLISQIERFVRDNRWTIELYSQRVSQLDGVRSSSGAAADSPASIAWHKVSAIPGPHLLKYLWWFFANQWQRRSDRRSGRVVPDLVYSPGVNCFDADVVVVHIVFHAFYDQVRPQLALSRTPLRDWPLVIHRRAYYRLIMYLEQKLYRNPRTELVAVSGLVAGQLRSYFQRDDVNIIPNAVDTLRFNLQTRIAKRTSIRASFGYAEIDFVLLLIGNDLKKKGLDALLKAVSTLTALPLHVLVVSADNVRSYPSLRDQLGLRDRVRFEKPSPDVLSFYAAADVYVGPSLEDAFNLPVLEAMASGLPVIASSRTGAAELIHDGKTGFILENPQDYLQLAELIRRIHTDEALRVSIGETASLQVQRNCSWDKNAQETAKLLERVLQKSQA